MKTSRLKQVIAVIGVTVPLVGTLGAIWLLGRQFSRLGSGMVAGGTLGPVDWALLAAIPVAGVLLAMVTARLTVLVALRRIL